LAAVKKASTNFPPSSEIYKYSDQQKK